MRLNYDDDDKVEVQMSPLLDCVFLLLIFFLVTTMMKKWEMQIPLTLPTMTSSLSTIIEEGFYYNLHRLQLKLVYDKEKYSKQNYTFDKLLRPCFLDDFNAFILSLIHISAALTFFAQSRRATTCATPRYCYYLNTA